MFVIDADGESSGRGLLSLNPGIEDDQGSYEEDIFDERELFSSTQLADLVDAQSPPSSSSSRHSESDSDSAVRSSENVDPDYNPDRDSDVEHVRSGRIDRRRTLGELRDNRIVHAVSDDEEEDGEWSGDEEASESLLARRNQPYDDEGSDSLPPRHPGEPGGGFFDDDRVCNLFIIVDLVICV
jgi:hypothetical protein